MREYRPTTYYEIEYCFTPSQRETEEDYFSLRKPRLSDGAVFQE